MSTEQTKDASNQPAWVRAVASAEAHFRKTAAKHGAVDWDEEVGYIRSAFESDQKLQTATPQSIVSAIRHIAAVGISISPIHQFAFLQTQAEKVKDAYGNDVKNNGKDVWQTLCKLKIGFKGHIQLLTSTGAVNWIRADVVREGDNFVYKGPLAMPDIDVPNPFATERNNVIGAYALAELPSGTVYCEIMRAEELAQVEKASKSGSSGPWKNEFKSEMQKKAAINRLYKTVPKNPANIERIHTAQVVSGDSDGFNFVEQNNEQAATRIKPTDEQIKRFIQLANAGDGFGLLDYEAEIDNNELWMGLFNSLPDKHKTSGKKKVREATSAAHKTINETHEQLNVFMNKGQTDAAQELLTETPFRYILPLASDTLIDWVGDELGEAA